MQLIQDIIGSGAGGVISTFPPLSNQTVKEFKMTTSILPPLHLSIKTCCILDCSRTHSAKGYCKMHYTRMLRHGDVDKRKPGKKTDFWDYIIKGSNEDDCWQWTGPTRRRGYGRITINQQTYSAHRYSYFLEHGEWPMPSCLHSCDNPPCCNPKHLRAGTEKENANDREERGRGMRGENNHKTKLTVDEVIQIKRELSLSVSVLALAKRYGVNRSTIRHIQRGDNWKWLKAVNEEV